MFEIIVKFYNQIIFLQALVILVWYKVKYTWSSQIRNHKTVVVSKV